MKGLPPNTPYHLTHLVAITFQHQKVLSKVADEKYLYQREGCVEVEQSGQGEEVIVMVTIDKAAEVNVSTYGDGEMAY